MLTNSLSLKGKTAIVSGGNRGIGRAVALAFAHAGAKVMLVARDVESLQKTADSIESAGGEAAFVNADISLLGDIERTVQEAVGAFGRIDILVNAAAGFLLNKASTSARTTWAFCTRIGSSSGEDAPDFQWLSSKISSFP